MRRPYSSTYPDESAKPEPPKPLPKEQLYEAAWQEYCKLIGRPVQKPNPKPPKQKAGTRRKLIVVCDTHGDPHKAGIEKALSEKPDLMLFVGDVMDCFAFSRFEKNRTTPIEQEMANIRAMAERVSSVCPSKWVLGNHDSRTWKYFVRTVNPEFMHLVNTNILETTLRGLDNCEIVVNNHTFTSGCSEYKDVLESSFLVFEGDAVFGHAETARKYELTTVRAFEDWYDLWRRPLGWVDARVIGQAHTHRAGIGYSAGGHRVHLELGAMLNPAVLDYQFRGDIRYTPVCLGYTVMEQNLKEGLWTTDLNSVRFVLC